MNGDVSGLTDGDNREPMHPRPTLARRDWTDLNGSWQFAFDDDDRGLAEAWFEPDTETPFNRRITVPFPFESSASGIGDPSFHPVCWYRRSLDLTVDGSQRVLLHVGALDHEATIWLNGRLVGQHVGGQVAFTADLTDAIAAGPDQTLVIRCVDRPTDLEQPRGKQDWQPEPHVIWYPRTSGIWKPVWLEKVQPTHVTALRLTPTEPLGGLNLDLRLSRSHPQAEIDVSVTLNGQLAARQSLRIDHDELHTHITLQLPTSEVEPAELAWSPEQPNLCDVRITVRDSSGVLDEVHSYTGLRSVAVDRHRLLLNGLPYYPRTVLSQGFWPDTHLAAPSADAIRAEVELIKSLGFNGVRVHQKVEDPRFLYWCDRLGLIVFADSAAAYRFTPRALANSIGEWLDIVAQNANHPSIVAWVAFNESWGVADVARDASQQHAVRALYNLLKAVDPSRLVIGNDGWEYVAGDLIGVHDYTQDPQAIADRYCRQSIGRTLDHGRPGGRVLLTGEQPAVPVWLSEFGGRSLADPDQSTWTGYGSATSADEFADDFVRIVHAVTAADGLAGFCYTQLADTAQERNGLVTEHRKPKVNPARVAAAIRGDRDPQLES